MEEIDNFRRDLKSALQSLRAYAAKLSVENSSVLDVYFKNAMCDAWKRTTIECPISSADTPLPTFEENRYKKRVYYNRFGQKDVEQKRVSSLVVRLIKNIE